MDKGRTEFGGKAGNRRDKLTVDALGAGSGSFRRGAFPQRSLPQFLPAGWRKQLHLRHRGDSGISEEPEAGASSIELLSAGSSTGHLQQGRSLGDCGIAFLSRRIRLRGGFFQIRDGGLVGMLGDGDAAENDILCSSHGNAVVFQGEIARFRAYRVDSFVQQVPLAGREISRML